MTVELLHGDCVELMRRMPDDSVDAVVTDPPYELGFMGKAWDGAGIAYSLDMWGECLRVLKPGGHLLAFGGTRTYHRMACAIEDAEFEIRDSIHWVYGSGFPKSLDVSKAIDKGTGENRARQLEFTAWMRSTGLSQEDCANAIRVFAKNDATARAMAQHYYSDKQQPAIPVADIFDVLRPLLPDVPERIERLVAERTGIEWHAYKQRRKIGSKVSAIANSQEGPRHTIGASKAVEVDVTAPATDDAKRWEGWGTALKPAHEPIVVARKPLAGTVAGNVLEWSTGGLNIDGCRVGTTAEDFAKLFAGVEAIRKRGGTMDNSWKNSSDLANANPANTAGRWPANVVFDSVAGEALDKQQEGASRFFTCADWSGDDWPFVYVPKPGKKERNAGLDGLQQQRNGKMMRRANNTSDEPSSGFERFDTAPASNHHPTVKPVALMRHLVRLVTPPDGTVLDPFAGSGTTLVAAVLEGFNAVGCEMTDEYLPIIEGRVAWAQQEAERRTNGQQPNLFQQGE